jgi:sugar O-acyltransferase (sialic acid O-acetyltransferase NeuD family)
MDREIAGTTIEGLPVHWIRDVGPLTSSHVAVCALATTHRSRFTNEAAEMGLQFTTIVHPSARVSSTSQLGEGSIVNVGVIVAAHSKIGRHALLSRGVLIGHHTTIGDHVSVMPGANIAGNCRIGDATYVGMGAIIIDNLRIGSHSVVGAGAVVIADVPDNVLVVGNPARVVRENIPGK